jgi:hypothetical protein
MARDYLGLVKLLQVLLLLLRQHLPPGGDGLIQSLNLAEADDGA